jgi:DNA invertase Pin-like site-specific DNA recombinase
MGKVPQHIIDTLIKRGFALYRVSDPSQALVQHGSLEQQENMVTRWVKDQLERTGIEYRIIKTFNEDISGRKHTFDKRSSIQEIRMAIRQGKIDFLVVEKIDRLSRYQIGNLQLMEEANQYGVEVYEFESGLIDFRDRGKRLGFNIKNMLAEEYSLDLSEKVSKKGREARVNNGKDTSTCPVLGLDAHPTRKGIYQPNRGELKIVEDIMQQFCALKSYKETSKYCKKQGYKTKRRVTKEKTDSKGNTIPPRHIGGEDFTSNRVRLLVRNSKYRGYGFFKDDWNQFPKLQDDDGLVRWEYFHHKEYGAVIKPELIENVWETIAEIKGTRHKPSKDKTIYLLSGFLKGHDGSNFHGETAKDHKYYRNQTLNLRIRKAEIEKVVLDRVKEYITENKLLDGAMKMALNNETTGLPSLKSKLTKLRKEETKLNKLLDGFTESIRETVLVGPQDQVKQVIETLMDEKQKITAELEAIKKNIEAVSCKITEMEANFDSANAEKFIKAVLGKFSKVSTLQQKRLLQTIIPRITILNGNKVALTINPCPSGLKAEKRTHQPIPVGPQVVGHKNKMCHGGNPLGISSKWRERRDSNPRPSA